MVGVGTAAPQVRTPAGTSVAPYAEALVRFAAHDPLRLTVPGHKGGVAAPVAARALLGGDPLALDVPLLTAGVDMVDEPAAADPGRVRRRAAGLHRGPGPAAPLREAEDLAAAAWGAARTFFLTNGASRGNHAACLAAACARGPVVVQRTAHSSTFDGLVLAGLRTRYVALVLDARRGIALGVTPAALDAVLAATPSATAAFVVSPTYHGAVADVRGLAAVAHRHRAALVVDEAWGAHLALSDALPEHALAAGADLVVSSTHKHLGSLTGSAMLHVGAGAPDRLAPAAVAAALRLVSSTSPSSVLRASLDAARARAEADGAALLAAALPELAALRGALRDLPGVDVLGERDTGRPGMAALDPLRVCLDVAGTGRTGWEVARRLRRHADVHLELAEQRVAVALFGLGEPVAEPGARLVAALRALVTEEHAKASWRHDAALSTHVAWRGHAALLAPPAPVVSLREATFAPSRVAPVARAAGAIAAEALTPYPPGIPVVLPGERLDAPRLAALRAAVRAGTTLRGAHDPAFDHVRVLA